MGFYTEFEKSKIVYPDIAARPEFAYDIKGRYGGNTLYIIPTDELFLLGILNSPVVHFFYSKISSTVRGGYFRFIATYMSQIPIPDANPEQQNAMEMLIRRLLAVEGEGPQVAAWERGLNEIVYGLYGLTDEEIALVEAET